MNAIENIPSLITVRSGSSRLPNKCFLSFGEGCVLEHVVQRAKHFGLHPIVCTTNEPEDDKIVALAKRADVLCYRGPTDNKLLRWSECCKHFKLDAFHSVDADDPFFCGAEVKRSFALLKEGFDMVAPTPSSSSGGATVGYSLTSEIVARACEGLDASVDTEMMWSHIECLPHLKKTVLSDPKDHEVKARMTLDYWEDYVMLEAIRLIVGNLASRSEVSKLLKSNPGLEKINAFRSVEWSRAQQVKSQRTGMFS